jgi:hypothetical protein
MEINSYEKKILPYVEENEELKVEEVSKDLDLFVSVSYYRLTES